MSASEVSRKPILVFDTSVINRLSNENDFRVLAAGLTTAYSIRLTGSNISELTATPEAERRTKLFDTCQRLLASGDCIQEFGQIVEKHVKTFDRNPQQYDWTRVETREPQIEREIVDRTLFNDEMANEQKQSSNEAKKAFEDIFCSMKPGFDKIFSAGTDRPDSFAEFVKVLQKSGGAFWTGYGSKFYSRNVEEEPDEAKVRDFATRCPPFMMMVLAAVMAQYARAIVETPKKKKRAGRVDLLMSVYLPYCRVFVTHDRDHKSCLCEMAAAANLDQEILSYDDFLGRLRGL